MTSREKMSTKDPKVKSQTIFLILANNELTYKFVLSMIICYEFLFEINKVSKSLQCEIIELSIAL